MQGRNLIGSLLAVIGVWLIVREIPDYVTSLYLTFAEVGPVSAAGPSVIMTQSLHFILSAATGLALIIVRRRLASWLQPDDSIADFGAEPLFAAGVAILGLYFTVTGLVVLGQLFAIGEGLGDQSYAVWSSIISVVVGLFVLLIAPLLTRLWRKVYRAPGSAD